MSDRMVVFILGIGRSGTSALAGALEQQGLPLGPADRTPHPHNPNGHFENPAVQALNEALLGIEEVETPRLRKPVGRDRIAIESILARYREPFFGVKEANLLFTLPAWLEQLGSAWIMATVRHPARVAKSVAARRTDENRPQFATGDALERWRFYYDHLLRLRRQVPFPIFNFDSVGDEYFVQLRSAVEALGLIFDEDGARSFISQELIHQRQDEQLSGAVADIYNELVALSREPVRWQPLTLEFARDICASWPWAKPTDERSEMVADIFHDRRLSAVEAMVEAQRLQVLLDESVASRDLEIERLQALLEEAVAVRDAEITRLQGMLAESTVRDSEIPPLEAPSRS